MEANKEYLEITAAKDAGGKHRVAGLAYSGGKMRLFGWARPVVVDLSGMTVPESVPLLANHENHTLGRVGVVTAKADGGRLAIEGDIVAGGELAEAIVAQGKAGADWQLSIGAEVEAAELVQEGRRKVNGVEHDAPFYHVTKSTLREVSVVAVGADRSTHMTVTAQLQLKGNSMAPDTPTATPAAVPATVETPKDATASATPATVVAAASPERPAEPTPDAKAIAAEAVKAERDRVTMVKSVCGSEFPEIEAKAIAEGWDRNTVNEAVLKAYRAKQPTTTPPSVTVKKSGMTEKTLEAALSLRAGIDAETLAKDMGEETVDAAMKDSDMPLAGILSECMRLEGMDVPRTFDNAGIKAAFSTVSLPGILSNRQRRHQGRVLDGEPAGHPLQRRAEEAPAGVPRPADHRDAPLHVGRPLRLQGEPALPPHRHRRPQAGRRGRRDQGRRRLGGEGRQPARHLRQEVLPDAQDDHQRRPRRVPQGADRDGQPRGPLFAAPHKNLLTGASSALSADSLKKAIQLFLNQTDADGQPINVEPSILLVPTALKFLAQELTQGPTLVMSGGAENVIRPSVNVLANEGLTIVSSPYLSNAKYDGASDAAWYLFGKPGTVDTFEIGYLKGKRTPTVERGDLDFNVLGIWFRVYFDVGIREQDHRGMVKANGAAA